MSRNNFLKLPAPLATFFPSSQQVQLGSGNIVQEPVRGLTAISFVTTRIVIPSVTMHRALTSRARASALSPSTAAKFRAGAGLSQQLRFAHKVRGLSRTPFGGVNSRYLY